VLTARVSQIMTRNRMQTIKTIARRNKTGCIHFIQTYTYTNILKVLLYISPAFVFVYCKQKWYYKVIHSTESCVSFYVVKDTRYKDISNKFENKISNLWPWYINTRTNIMFPDIIHRPRLLKTQYFEIWFCPRLQVRSTQLGPINRASPYLRTPAPTQNRVYKSSTIQTIYES
jgi:hypothetical protein